MAYTQWLPKPGRTCEQAEQAADARLHVRVGKELWIQLLSDSGASGERSGSASMDWAL